MAHVLAIVVVVSVTIVVAVLIGANADWNADAY